MPQKITLRAELDSAYSRRSPEGRLAARIGLPSGDAWLTVNKTRRREELSLVLDDIGSGGGFDGDEWTDREDFGSSKKIASVWMPDSTEEIIAFLKSFKKDFDREAIEEAFAHAGACIVMARTLEDRKPSALLWVNRSCVISEGDEGPSLHYSVRGVMFVAAKKRSDAAAAVFSMFTTQVEADLETLTTSAQRAGYKGAVSTFFNSDDDIVDIWARRAKDNIDMAQDTVIMLAEPSEDAPEFERTLLV